MPHLDVDANELALVYRAGGCSHRRQRNTHVRCWPRCTWMPSHQKQLELTRMRRSALPGARPSPASASSPGALVPVLPYLFGASGWAAILIAAALVGIALLGTGAVVGLLSGASPLKRALRQLAIGYAPRPPPISWAVRSVPPWVKRVSCSGPPQRRGRLSKKGFNDDAKR